MENAAMNRAENHAAANVNDQVWQVCQTVGKKNAMRRVSHGMKKVRKRRESVHTQIDLIGRQLQAVAGFAALAFGLNQVMRGGRAKLFFQLPIQPGFFSVRKIC